MQFQEFVQGECEGSITHWIQVVNTTSRTYSIILHSLGTSVFSVFYIILYLIGDSLKSLRFYENNFEGLCVISLDDELSLWEHHHNDSVQGLLAM